MANDGKWNRESLEAMYEQILGSRDLSDPKVRRRLTIVKAAGDLFVAQGYRKTSIDEIARRAGVAKGTVYLYFKNKVEIMVHVIGEEKIVYMEQLLKIFDEEVPPAERLRDWLRIALRMGAEMPITAKLMQGDRELLMVMAEMDPELLKNSESFRLDFIGDLIDQAAGRHRWTREELNDRTNTLIGLIYCGAQFADDRIRGGLSLERFAGILADTIVDGIVARDLPSNEQEKGGVQ